MKKAIAVFMLIIALIWTNLLPAYAVIGTICVADQRAIDQMTNAERNAYITQIKNRAESARSIQPMDLKRAWYAAAKIAEQFYPNAALLVQHSVWGVDYIETNGPISMAIRNSSEYRAWAETCTSPSIAFLTGDLFYGIHLAEIQLLSHGSAGGQLYVHDVFDFAFDSEYGSGSIRDILVTCVNDWAWLCVHSGALEEIDVSITFTDGLIGTYSIVYNEEIC